MKILLTGKKGQLGSEIKNISNKSSHHFVFVDIEDGDITNLKLLRDLCTTETIDTIINCAAYTAVDAAEKEPELAQAVNATGVQNLVTVCEERNIRLLHISTDYVFNGEGSSPYKPNDPVSPLGIYGKTKRAGEEALLQSSIQGVILRTSWVYSTFGGNFVKTMLRLGAERDTLNVVNDQIGCPTYARDLAHVCLKLIEADWSVADRIYHFSNTGAITWFDFATEIMRLSGLHCKVQPIPSSEFPTPAKRPGYSVLDTTNLSADFGIVPRKWQAALDECIREIE